MVAFLSVVLLVLCNTGTTLLGSVKICLLQHRIMIHVIIILFNGKTYDRTMFLCWYIDSRVHLLAPLSHLYNMRQKDTLKDYLYHFFILFTALPLFTLLRNDTTVFSFFVGVVMNGDEECCARQGSRPVSGR